MALITISGYPCSGKSRRATQLKDHLERRLADPAYTGPSLTVTVLSDDVLNVPRSAYDDSLSEKPARAALFTAVQRHLGLDRIVLVDAPNYIKGFRYQMYCSAREAKVRVCTIYVLAPPEQCRAWNHARDDGRSYAPQTLDNLLQRFEEPSSMVRWDAPLFTVPWTDPDVPADDIWRAITHGAVKPPNTGTQAVAIAPTDALHALERTTSTLVSAVLAAQAASTGPGGALSLSVPTATASTPSSSSSSSGAATEERITLTLPPRHVTLSELQRLKRQFVALHKRAVTLGTTEKGAVDWREARVAHKFVAYIQEHVGM